MRETKSQPVRYLTRWRAAIHHDRWDFRLNPAKSAREVVPSYPPPPTSPPKKCRTESFNPSSHSNFYRSNIIFVLLPSSPVWSRALSLLVATLVHLDPPPSPSSIRRLAGPSASSFARQVNTLDSTERKRARTK